MEYIRILHFWKISSWYARPSLCVISLRLCPAEKAGPSAFKTIHRRAGLVCKTWSNIIVYNLFSYLLLHNFSYLFTLSCWISESSWFNISRLNAFLVFGATIVIRLIPFSSLAWQRELMQRLAIFLDGINDLGRNIVLFDTCHFACFIFIYFELPIAGTLLKKSPNLLL